ncbi:hypothetical protein ACFP56_10585 [Paenibacillus septentrionalis]|uniref:Uncharacterized protein n=1 Tax=Paenibacillus septentrionalis TaxID=429342 RepID=A0ABW1V6N6_9BACL
MKDLQYVIYAAILGIVSFFTGEIVTFIMLGIILMALSNMLKVQKEILKKLENQSIQNDQKEE